MICTNVVPCLSSGFAKINKLIRVCPISPVFSHFESLVFFRKMGGGGGGEDKPHTKAVKQDVCSQFLKLQQLSQFFRWMLKIFQ